MVLKQDDRMKYDITEKPVLKSYLPQRWSHLRPPCLEDRPTHRGPWLLGAPPPAALGWWLHRWWWSRPAIKPWQAQDVGVQFTLIAKSDCWSQIDLRWAQYIRQCRRPTSCQGRQVRGSSWRCSRWMLRPWLQNNNNRKKDVAACKYQAILSCVWSNVHIKLNNFKVFCHLIWSGTQHVNHTLRPWQCHSTPLA